MAMVRLALRNLQTKVSSSAFPVYSARAAAACDVKEYATNAANLAPNESKEIASDHATKKPLSKKQRRKSWRPWNALFQPPRRDIMEMFPSGLGYALLNATQNINKLLESMNIAPAIKGLPTWKLKEQDHAYKLRFQVPGLSKEDLKITVEDGMLHITGEHKEEEEEGEEDELWSAKLYGFYDTSLMLPEDAKVDEIQAELKNGVLSVIIPRATEKPRKEDVKEIEVAG
ncbi:hypothetical protein QQ045_022592 [Rhodiola kirilowii]